MFFIARNHRHHKVFLYLMAAELPFTIVILAFTGIASNNTYRTKLWQDGSDNGFNSSPSDQLYAAANYKPYSIPMVWSPFLTNYNLVLGVLSTFFLITKVPVHMMRLFYPPFSVFIHAALMALYIVSARFQAGSDMSDPLYPQPGPPWYITKKCTVAAHASNIGYCRQAKSLFVFTVVIIGLYFVEFCMSIHSCFITEEEKAVRLEKAEEDRAMKEYEEVILKTPVVLPPMSPAAMSSGALTPAYPPQGMPTMTPRSLAFHRLGGERSPDLPLREYSNAPEPRPSMQQEPVVQQVPVAQPQPQMYFPPPPKKAAKK